MIRVAVIGASGYSGAELLRILLSRDDVSIEHVFAQSSAGKRVDELYPVFSGSIDLQFESFDPNRMESIDLAFVALPSGEAMKAVPLLLPIADRVIDLGGDFRLPSVQLYEQFYKHIHVAADLLDEAVYGLPELHKEQIAGARLIANPGCYPTSVILALLPALQAEIISPSGIVINSLSGVSGAGRTASVDFSFSEVNENIRAYKIGTHQHIPEIQSVLEHASGKSVSLSFVPHLVPMTRGIYTTIHADLQTGISEEEILSIYQNHYAGAPFVRVKRQVPRLRDVVYTNYCDIAFTVDKRTNKLIVISVIDNLLKGASGQAVQNMNIMFGLPETQGLISIKEKQHV
jgi:N-acetyl-gamma-glutamyl-phosphate reductase